ncbi:hypothetical protein J2X31_000242 [Flavobacterium arsenatis]|uniref:Outer membrane protein beta-barrel domain-containing protein n=1 Tax=Flavobacterium arsenatis TaxID=1484332 RepID=A0ABU1TJY9_9FLAO|nr:hypothetical protein [Flavobacterium arsenatis]MDR6966249.1 hypothetical protein [Flavobacterium arsenatis]
MKNLIASILILLVGPVFGQAGEGKAEDKKFTLNPWDNINGFRVATSYYKNFEFEASYLISSYPRQEPGFGGFAMLVQYVGAGIEYVNVGNQHAIGAKLSYEANFSIFSAQVGGDIIASDQDFQYRMLPRIGVSVFGLITAYYGWNYNLRKESELMSAEHIFTLQFNLLNH